MEEVALTPPMSVNELKGQITTVQNVLRNIMQDGVHYGKIPGCGPKPTLLKPGAEKILATFHIGTELDVEEYSEADNLRYRVTAKGFHLPTGHAVGQGVGECSTAEEKYAWRGAVCPAEWEEADPLQRREKWLRTGSKIKQVRTNPADAANTVLKMAKKRAVVDLCLSATACSDIFTQDIEDMPRENIVKNTASQTPPRPPQRKSEPEPVQHTKGMTREDVMEAAFGEPSGGGIKLTKCEVFNGTSKAGKAYTKYRFFDTQNEKYDTFSESHAKIGNEAIDAGGLVIIDSEATRWGNNINDIRLA